MPLTVCLLKPRILNHALAKIVRTLRLSGLTLVGLRVVTLDKSSATSLLPAESVTENDSLTERQAFLFMQNLGNSYSVSCCLQDPSDLEAHVEFLCSGSSLALCLEGENAVRGLLDVLSQEDSSLWATCYGMAHSYNGIYGQCPVLHTGTRSRTGS